MDHIHLFIRLKLISNFIDQLRRRTVIFCHLLGQPSFGHSLRTVGKLLKIIHYHFSSCFYDMIRNVLLLAFRKTIILPEPKSEHTITSILFYFQATLPITSPKDH